MERDVGGLSMSVVDRSLVKLLLSDSKHRDNDSSLSSCVDDLRSWTLVGCAILVTSFSKC